MWLPQQERHLLMVYDVCISRLASEGTTFRLDELAWFAAYSYWVPFWRAWRVKKRAKALRTARDASSGTPASADTSSSSGSNLDMPRWLREKEAVEVANRTLQDRHLVSVREDGTGIYSVTMTLEGRDLGRKYNTWFDRSGLWFREYKDHWVWLVVSFLGGVLGALIVQSLSD